MMRNMTNAEAGTSGTPAPGNGRLTALAGLLALYVLWMGSGIPPREPCPHPWFFLAPWWLATTGKYLLLAGGLAAGLYWGGDRVQRRLPAVLAALLLGGQLWVARAAWATAGGAVPWGFDHPSFMFRFREFANLFPFALGGYNPWWNAGTEHFVGVTSGAHGFGLLILPLLKIWEPHQFYGAALIFWFVFGFPWLGVAALRAAGTGRAGALCAGLLLCGASRGVFVWMWHFGTVGAMTSAMMALPVAALGYRLAVLNRGSWGTALALGLAAWLMCLWTPGVFIGAGLALGWLCSFQRWTWRANRWLLAAGALALLLLAPWIWTTLFPCRNVVAYVGTDMPRPTLAVMIIGGARRLLTAIQEWHPVLVVFGLAGTVLAAPRELRRWILPVFAVLGVVAGWSREFKPLSQLDRMAIPLAVVAGLPAAMLCGRLLGDGAEAVVLPRRRAVLQALAQGLVLATLLFGWRSVRLHYANEAAAPLRLPPPEMAEFIDWIRAEVPPEGRLGFAGRAVHFYGGGNTAYLPVLAGREMMGDDYYGFPAGTIEYNYPPDAYRRDPDRYLFFTRTYGITHWTAVRPEAQAFLASHSEWFELAKTWDMLGRRIVVYRVRDADAPSRFWEGAGRVVARENRLEVYPEDSAAERVVLRYNWRDGLFCRTPGAAIEPHAVDENIRFIAVHPGGQACVVIGYRPHAAPIQPNFDGRFHH